MILAAEDGMRDTIIPRLIAADADLKRVKILTARVTLTAADGSRQISPMSFQDLDYWDTLIRRHRPCLLVADPLPAFLGRGVNDHRNAEVRAVLEPFIDLLNEHRVSMSAITHVGKSTDARTPAHKVLVSIDYVNIIIELHMTALDPDDKDRRLLMQIRNNLGPLQPALAFRIE